MSSAEGREVFENEAMMMISLQHRNLVKLFGYCAHKNKRLLVYEFVSGGSLDQLLFGKDSNGKQQLDWPRRYGIIQDIAWGLRYFHQHSPKSIIHGDIKPYNILIDKQWKTIITAFWTSHTLQPNETEVRVDGLSGTWGYIAPELVYSSTIATQKRDVYSLGVTILEIISSKRVNKFDGFAKNMMDEAYELYQEGRSLEFMDRTLEASAIAEEVDKCFAIGLLCVQGDPELRPDMKDVVFMLENQGDVERTIGRPGLRGYNDRFRVNPSNPDSPIFIDSDDDIVLPR